MILTEENLVIWKSDIISAMNVEKSSFIADLESQGYLVSDETGTNIEDWINAISYNNLITSDVIKSQLTTLYSYCSLKYSTIFVENNIDPVDICTNNSLLNLTPIYELPTSNEIITVLPFIATELINEDASGGPAPFDPPNYSVTIEKTPEFNIIEIDIPAHAIAELDSWKNLPDSFQNAISDKVLFQLFRSSKTKDIFKSTKDYLLDDMKLEEFIIDRGMNNDFNILFPQIPLL